MADISQIPNFQLKVIFFIHVLFFSIASTGYWAPTGYIFYNVMIIVLVLHVIIGDNLETLKIGLVLNGASVILDVFVIALHFPHGYIFSGIIAIIFLLIKPATTYVMFKIVQERSDSPSGPVRNISDIFTTNRSSYEDIDRTVAAPQPPHPSKGGYDISTAQQI